MRRFDFKLFYMHVKHVMQLKPKLKIFFSLIVAFVLVLYGCQKELSNDGTDLYERFYKLPKDASSSLTDMASSIRKLENQLNIAHSVVAHNSLPVWSNSLLIDSKDAANTASASSRGAIETGTGSFRTVVTAVADIATNEITGYIKFMRANDTVRVRYVEKSMALNKYQMASNKPEKDKAVQDLFFFAYFEKELNQVEKLKLKNITITANSAGSSIDALMQACITRLCHSWGYNYFDNNGTLIAVSGWECYYVGSSCGGGAGGGGVSYQNCGNGGPCPGSGGYGSGSGGSLTGGSGSNGSNYWGPPIYSTQEGTGNGNGNGNPRDSLIRDSTIKDFLNKDMIAFKSAADSAFTLDNNVREWGFFIGMNSSVRGIRDFHTDSIEIVFQPNWKLAFKFDTCFGTIHTHSDPIVNDRMVMDVTDVFLLDFFLTDSKNKGKYFPRCYVNCGDKIYVAVIEDRDKASVFFHSNDEQTLLDRNSREINANTSGTTRRQRSISAILGIFGNSSTSGIGFYESIPTANLTFIKLN
jgi:hypothetical protein